MIVLTSQLVGSGGTVIRPTPPPPKPTPMHGVLDSPLLPKAAMVLSAYHGLRRNRGSILWGLAWGAAGRLFPLIVPALAIAQGYGKEKSCQ